MKAKKDKCKCKKKKNAKSMFIIDKIIEDDSQSHDQHEFFD